MYTEKKNMAHYGLAFNLLYSRVPISNGGIILHLSKLMSQGKEHTLRVT